MVRVGSGSAFGFAVIGSPHHKVPGPVLWGRRLACQSQEFRVDFLGKESLLHMSMDYQVSPER